MTEKVWGDTDGLVSSWHGPYPEEFTHFRLPHTTIQILPSLFFQVLSRELQNAPTFCYGSSNNGCTLLDLFLPPLTPQPFLPRWATQLFFLRASFSVLSSQFPFRIRVAFWRRNFGVKSIYVHRPLHGIILTDPRALQYFKWDFEMKT